MPTNTEKTAGCGSCPIMEKKYKNNPRSLKMRLIVLSRDSECPGSSHLPGMAPAEPAIQFRRGSVTGR
jgi:hypothetical protein